MKVMNNYIPPKEFLQIVESQLESYQTEIDAANLKIQKLEDKNWKDDTVKKLNLENNKLKESLEYGFGISFLEDEKIKQWQYEHTSKFHISHHNIGMTPLITFSYHFLPTSIGTLGFCRCEICYDRILRKNFSNSSISNQELQKKAKENDVDFYFQHL